MANPSSGDVAPIVNHCTAFNDKYTMFFLFLSLKIVYCATREEKIYFASVKFDARAKRE